MVQTTTGRCISRRGTPLRAFQNRADGEDAARHVLAAYGNRMVPYPCARCGCWHLCPAERYTPSHECYACSKQAYDTEEGAKRRGAILKAERGVNLDVYPCRHGEGWHLTSSW